MRTILEFIREQMDYDTTAKIPVSTIDDIQVVLDMINAESDLEANLDASKDFIIVTKY